MIVHRFSRNDGSYAWTKGKTEALGRARKHAKATPKNVALRVEAVTLKPYTTKNLILALLNGDDIAAEDDDGEPMIEVLAEIKGRLPPKKEKKVQPVALTAPKGEDPESQEYVVVYPKNGPWRLVLLEDVRPGMRVETYHPSKVTTAEVKSW